MIPTIRKILYATDLSINSEHAFSYAVNSARQHNAEIVILHAIEPPPQNVQAIMGAYMKDGEWLEENKKAAVAVLTDRIRTFTEREFTADPEGAVPISAIIIVDGYPAEVILKKVDELECDIIIMGTHSKGVISHAFLGSVAERVLRRIKKPVFIIPVP